MFYKQWNRFVIWLALRVSKINQILCCDWFLPARDYPLCPAKTFVESHRAIFLFTKFEVIGLGLFLVSLWPTTPPRSINTQKSTWSISSHWSRSHTWSITHKPCTCAVPWNRLKGNLNVITSFIFSSVILRLSGFLFLACYFSIPTFCYISWSLVNRLLLEAQKTK